MNVFIKKFIRCDHWNTGRAGNDKVPLRIQIGIRESIRNRLIHVEHNPIRGVDSFDLYLTTATKTCSWVRLTCK